MKKWVPSSHLQRGDRASRLVLAFPPWAALSDWESGYLAGFLDGEGSVSFSLRHVTVSFSQAANPALALAVEILQKRGFAVGGVHRAYVPKKGGSQPIHHVYVKGGLRDALRLLGQVRPPRLLERFAEHATIGDTPKLHGAQGVRVVEKEAIGRRKVVSIETSTGTLVADGYVCANNSRAQFARLA
jgi:hypothetical protein